jgi:hypothetical protein
MIFSLPAMRWQPYYRRMKRQNIRKTEELITFSEPLLSDIFTAATAMIRAELEELKYDPDQPRVPAGQPTGGQWTDVGVVLPENASPDDNSILEYVTTIKTPQGKTLNRANIFIGGAGDTTLGDNVKKSNSLHKYTYGNNYYATNDAQKRIIALIKRMPKGRRINLIGHSWGGGYGGRYCRKIT